MKRLGSLTLFAMISVSVTGCSDAVAPTETEGPMFQVTDHRWSTREYNTRYEVCTGEKVHVIATAKYLSTFTEDRAGGFHETFHRASTGKAIGVESGTVYNFNFVKNEKWNARPPFPNTHSMVWINYITPQGGGGKLEVRYKVQLTVNGNGEVVVDTDEITEVCKGG